MTKVFDFIDFITDLFDKFISFITQMIEILSSYHNLVNTFIFNCPPVFASFFSLFLIIAIILFIWRLIP